MVFGGIRSFNRTPSMLHLGGVLPRIRSQSLGELRALFESHCHGTWIREAGHFSLDAKLVRCGYLHQTNDKGFIFIYYYHCVRGKAIGACL